MKSLEAALILVVAILAIFFFVFTRALSTYVEAQDSPRFDLSYARCRDWNDSLDRSSKACILWQPSFPQLMAHPEAFHGKNIVLVGFVEFEYGRGGIYMHPEDREQCITQNGFRLGLQQGTNIDECASCF